MSSDVRKTFRRQEIADLCGDIIEKLLHERLKRADLLVSCLSCVYWSPDYEYCTRYHARPPAHIIVNGCPDYFDIEEIPF